MAKFSHSRSYDTNTALACVLITLAGGLCTGVETTLSGTACNLLRKLQPLNQAQRSKQSLRTALNMVTGGEIGFPEFVQMLGDHPYWKLLPNGQGSKTTKKLIEMATNTAQLEAQEFDMNEVN